MVEAGQERLPMTPAKASSTRQPRFLVSGKAGMRR